MFGRKKVAMMVAEFLGTGILTLVILAVQRSTLGIPYFVALAAGLAVAALTLVFANVSGAHLNPAVTFGALTARRVRILPAIMYLIMQMLGAWAAYGVYTYFVNSSFQPIGGHFTARLFVAEAVGAFVFTFAWAAVAAQRLTLSLAGVGYALGILIASIASVGLINPAVAVGTRAFAFWGSMGWGTYLAGPLLGGLIGFNLYDLFFGATAWGGAGLGFRPAGAARTTTATATTAAARPARRTSAAKKPATRRRR